MHGMTSSNVTIRNQLLASLDAEDLALLTPHLRPIDLELRKMIERPKTTIEHVCFPETGLLSVVAKANKRQIEVGILGREGMSGLALVFGATRTPFETFVQVAGSGLVMDAEPFKKAMDERPKMRQRFLCYARAFLVQTAYTALANGSANIAERLARWLLMSQDRLGTPEVGLTHEFLAIMLGVRRPGVTVALHSLEAQGLIRAKRGNIEIIDRQGLEKVARESYRLTENEYESLLGYRPGSASKANPTYGSAQKIS